MYSTGPDLAAHTVDWRALVGLGVILEAPKIFSIPVAAVFVGIVLEAACTLLLFGFDEGISASQQSEIRSQQIEIKAQQADIKSLLVALQPRTISDQLASSIFNFVQKKYGHRLLVAFTKWDQESFVFARQICAAMDPVTFRTIELAEPKGWNSELGRVDGFNQSLAAAIHSIER
jgi:hypothetical protein